MLSVQVRVPMATILPRIQRKKAAAAEADGGERPPADAGRPGSGGGLLHAVSAGSAGSAGGGGPSAAQQLSGARDQPAAALREVDESDEDADAMNEARPAHDPLSGAN